VVNVKPVSYQELDDWFIKQSQEHPLQKPKAADVTKWNSKQVSEFIRSIPIYQYNELYATIMIENNITGDVLLNCTQNQLKQWGIQKISHRGRIHGEILKMKRRI